MRVLAYDPFPNHAWAVEHCVEYVDASTLAAQSDVVSLHVPLTPETKYMIRRETLDQMKVGAILINISRGALVDTSAAIDALLARALAVPEPSEDACRRHHAAHASRFASGERVQVRHILFAVTPGVDVVALRGRAETTLLDVRCHDGTAGDGFAHAARTLSNCPSGAEGGALGWLTADDCAPEFAREIFGHAEIGVLPRLVHSRHGLHVVEVQARAPGVTPAFEAVRSAVVNSLRQQGFVTALRQYLQVLAGAAEVEGVDLDSADTPLVQ